MVQINPVEIWNNGVNTDAVFFDLACINDNMSTNANFYYKLLSQDLIILSAGNEMIEGEDYNNYNASTDSNNFAYNLISEKLNLKILENAE